MTATSKLAMVFPGQGSQSVGMMQAYGDLAPVRDTIAEASEVLGQDLERNVAIELRVPGAIDLTHSACAEGNSPNRGHLRYRRQWHP